MGGTALFHSYLVLKHVRYRGGQPVTLYIKAKMGESEKEREREGFGRSFDLSQTPVEMAGRGSTGASAQTARPF